MEKIGIKSVFANDLRTVKRDLLYFDQICFDKPSLNFSKEIAEQANQTTALLNFILENNLYDSELGPVENLEKNVLRLNEASQDIDAIINKELAKNGSIEQLEKNEEDIAMLIAQNILVPYDLTEILMHNHTVENDKIVHRFPKNPSIPPLSKQLKKKISTMLYDEFSFVKNLSDGYLKKRIDQNKIGSVSQDWFEAWENSIDRRVKIFSIISNLINQENQFIPIFDSTPSHDILGIKETEVLSLVINSFPSISTDTNWEQIFEFRSNSENNLRLLELRRWVRNMANSDLKVSIIKEELEYLLANYENALTLQKIKFRQTPLEIFVVTALDILSDTLTLKLGEAAKKIFDIKKAKVDYIIAANDLAGKEVGYILNTKETFREKNSG